MQRPSDEFWNARPSQIKYCRDKYAEILRKERQNPDDEVVEITSMKDIPGW